MGVTVKSLILAVGFVTITAGGSGCTMRQEVGAYELLFDASGVERSSPTRALMLRWGQADDPERRALVDDLMEILLNDGGYSGVVAAREPVSILVAEVAAPEHQYMTEQEALAVAKTVIELDWDIRGLTNVPAKTLLRDLPRVPDRWQVFPEPQIIMRVDGHEFPLRRHWPREWRTKDAHVWVNGILAAHDPGMYQAGNPHSCIVRLADFIAPDKQTDLAIRSETTIVFPNGAELPLEQRTEVPVLPDSAYYP